MMSDETQKKDVTVILETLKTIAAAVVGAANADNLRAMLQRIAVVAQQLVQTRYAALGVPSEHGTMQYFEVAGMNEADVRRIPHPPVGRGLLGVIMHEREKLRLEHMRDDPRHVGFPQHHPQMESLLGVPIAASGKLFGMLYLTDRLDGQPFTEADEWLVESLAGYAALAISGKHLSEQNARLALLEERERVGMELHDGVIQSLYAIGMGLQLLRFSHPQLADAISESTRSIDQVIADIRRYILNLKAGEDDEPRTLRDRLADSLSRLYIPDALDVTITVPDAAGTFPPAVMDTICQIATEAVSNLIRHAGASAARIVIANDALGWRMVIADDGRGFDPDATTMGFGLRNMRQRAHLLGGEVVVESAPGEGTRIIVTMPVG
jgi:signal transduction histidine kinase